MSAPKKAVRARVMYGHKGLTQVVFTSGRATGLLAFSVLPRGKAPYKQMVEQAAIASWNCKWRPATWELASDIAKNIQRDEQRAVLESLNLIPKARQ